MNLIVFKELNTNYNNWESGSFNDWITILIYFKTSWWLINFPPIPWCYTLPHAKDNQSSWFESFSFIIQQ